MTMREVDIALTNIGNRDREDIQFQAKLHGMKVKLPAKMQAMPFTENDRDKAAKAAEAINKRRFGGVANGR